jgi:uncharacterized RDD family membrane protein YckC
MEPDEHDDEVLPSPAEEPPLLLLAPYGRRAAGYILDWLVVFLIIRGVGGAAGLKPLGVLVLTFIVMIPYAGLLICFLDGMTLGMRALGLRCVNPDRVTKVTLGQAFYRATAAELMAACQLLGPIGLIAPAADLLWPAFDPERQTLHDKLAGTVVIRPTPTRG